MADLFKDRLQTYISNTPSTTGNFVIASAVDGWTTFGASDNSLSFAPLIVEGDDWELRKGCVYTHSTKTLTRGTLVSSSTGSAINFTVDAIIVLSIPASLMNTLNGKIHTITDSSFDINPLNGSIQIVTLTANRTSTAASFDEGLLVLLGVDDGNAYTINWASVNPTWVRQGGSALAPILSTTGYTWILLWKVGTVIYAGEVGKP